MITTLFNILPYIVAGVTAAGTVTIAFYDYTRKPRRALRPAPAMAAREPARLPLAA